MNIHTGLILFFSRAILKNIHVAQGSCKVLKIIYKFYFFVKLIFITFWHKFIAYMNNFLIDTKLF